MLAAVAFHLEPYHGRSVHTIREDLAYIHNSYSHSPALYRIGKSPVFYVYDSYHIRPGLLESYRASICFAAQTTGVRGHGLTDNSFTGDWRKLLSRSEEASVRGTELDGVFIGLWLAANDGMVSECQNNSNLGHLLECF